MNMIYKAIWLGSFAILSIGVALPGQSQPATHLQLSALQLVEPGQWEFHSADDSSAKRSMCITDPAIMLQLRHRASACTRFVIANDPKSSTVHYSCQGAGNGRTTVRVETPRLVQIESQGIADNAPFSFSTEGRRVGACNAGAGAGGGRR
jgi:hypothetical protein